MTIARNFACAYYTSGFVLYPLMQDPFLEITQLWDPVDVKLHHPDNM